MDKSDFDLNHQNQHIESKIVASLERISQSFRVLLWQESKEFALSPIQIQVLIFLLHHSDEKRKVSYIADEFNMTKATISETIKTLEQKELIHKEYEERDSRSYIIQLSNKGKEIAKKTSLFTKELGAPIHKLPNKEKENLLLNLLDIIRHLNNTGVISIQRMCKSCTYYQSSNKGKKHYCHLLNQALTAKDLRLDCPEHELKL